MAQMEMKENIEYSWESGEYTAAATVWCFGRTNCDSNCNENSNNNKLYIF